MLLAQDLRVIRQQVGVGVCTVHNQISISKVLNVDKVTLLLQTSYTLSSPLERRPDATNQH